MYPIWKDTYYSNYFETLEYYLRDVDEDKVVRQAYTKRMPGTTGVTLNINNMVDELLSPDFDSDFTQVSNSVIPNSKAFKTYQLRMGPIPGGHLSSYQFLYDWSYDNNGWTGETAHNMSEPIRHLDPRMKALFTIFNTEETAFTWDIEYEPYVKINPNIVMWKNTGGTKTIGIQVNTDWTLALYPGWIAVDITAGTGSYSAASYTNITLTALPNPTANKRTGTLLFTYPEGGSVFTIEQNGVLEFSVTPQRYDFDGTGGTGTITIDTNASWSATYPEWITISQTSGGTGVSSISFTVEPNANLVYPRAGSIVVYSGGKRDSVDIYQQNTPPAVEVIPSQITAEYTGGTLEFEINSNIDWYISSYPKWATPTALSGDSGSSILRVSLTGNPDTMRVGEIVFLEGIKCTKITSISIKQRGEKSPYINAIPQVLTFESTGGTQTLSIISNINWDIV